MNLKLKRFLAWVMVVWMVCTGTVSATLAQSVDAPQAGETEGTEKPEGEGDAQPLQMPSGSVAFSEMGIQLFADGATAAFALGTDVPKDYFVYGFSDDGSTVTVDGAPTVDVPAGAIQTTGEVGAIPAIIVRNGQEYEFINATVTVANGSTGGVHVVKNVAYYDGKVYYREQGDYAAGMLLPEGAKIRLNYQKHVLHIPIEFGCQARDGDDTGLASDEEGKYFTAAGFETADVGAEYHFTYEPAHGNELIGFVIYKNEISNWSRLGQLNQTVPNAQGLFTFKVDQGWNLTETDKLLVVAVLHHNAEVEIEVIKSGNTVVNTGSGKAYSRTNDFDGDGLQFTKTHTEDNKAFEFTIHGYNAWDSPSTVGGVNRTLNMVMINSIGDMEVKKSVAIPARGGTQSTDIDIDGNIVRVQVSCSTNIYKEEHAEGNHRSCLSYEYTIRVSNCHDPISFTFNFQSVESAEIWSAMQIGIDAVYSVGALTGTADGSSHIMTGTDDLYVSMDDDKNGNNRRDNFKFYVKAKEGYTLGTKRFEDQSDIDGVSLFVTANGLPYSVQLEEDNGMSGYTHSFTIPRDQDVYDWRFYLRAFPEEYDQYYVRYLAGDGTFSGGANTREERENHSIEPGNAYITSIEIPTAPAGKTFVGWQAELLNEPGNYQQIKAGDFVNLGNYSRVKDSADPTIAWIQFEAVYADIDKTINYNIEVTLLDENDQEIINVLQFLETAYANTELLIFDEQLAEEINAELAKEGLSYRFDDFELSEGSLSHPDLKENDTIKLTYKLKPQTGSLTITKTVVDKTFGTDTKKFSFTVQGVTDPNYSQTVEVEVNGATKTGSYTLNNLPAGDYTVTETVPAGYEVDGNNKPVTIVAGATETVTFTNTLETYSMTVTKEVSGNMADPNAKFNFTATLMKGDAAATGIAFDLGQGYTVNGNQATFTLGDGDSVTLAGIPHGYSVKVAETQVSGYQTKYRISSEWVEGTEASVGAFGISADSGASLTFMNTRSATIDTGVTLDALPYILLLAVAAGAVTLTVVTRRRRTRD